MIAGHRKCRRILVKCTGFGSILILLASCSQSAPNYCEAEGRVIPELEWKARALVVLQREGEQHLPPTMLRFVHQHLPTGGTDAAARDVFIEYIQKHPLCCQIDYKDRYGRLEMEYDVPTDELREISPKVTLYILGGSETEFIDLDERNKIKLENRASKSSTYPKQVPPVWSQVGISSCGDKVAIWKVGGGRYVGN